jgi:uncharacterized protein DUF4166
VRFIHTTESTVRGRGRLQIAHGRSRAVRVLARLLRLPRASDAAETRLVVRSRADEEQWLRTFDDRRLDTRQYQAGKCELAERIGVLEFRFRLGCTCMTSCAGLPVRSDAHDRATARHYDHYPETRARETG